MRGKTAKRLRRLAVKRVGSESNLYKNPDSSVKYDGTIREYRDLKKKWNKSDIFKKEVFFNE